MKLHENIRIFICIAMILCTCSNLFAQTMAQKLYLTINGVTHTATMVENSSTQALVEALTKANIVYEAHDYGNFEKVGALGQSFPQNNEQITTAAGDLILYTGNNLCIYYGTNSYSFTRIGKLDDMSQAEIKKWVNAGEGNVQITLSLQPLTTALNDLQADSQEGKTYTILGQIAPDDYTGVVIQNGKKIVK
ncbi:MAG: hypothetical protein II502_03610 [Paludibacteraceae bacterium]|nr:hypothetical protein [Paludibacteraceae bacterium]